MTGIADHEVFLPHVHQHLLLRLFGMDGQSAGSGKEGDQEGDFHKSHRAVEEILNCRHGASPKPMVSSYQKTRIHGVT